jgi:ABC-2 type transport system ATP-binding protein
MQPIISVKNLSKTYKSGFRRLRTLISRFSAERFLRFSARTAPAKRRYRHHLRSKFIEGSVTVGGHDIVRDYRATRSMIGLVPQELFTEMFETVWRTVTFSRGLFGKKTDLAHTEKVLRELSLWDKKDSQIRTLSGGMKRRVLIAEALVHEPQILFLDEPTAGVDVELRKDMWEVVRQLRASV